MINIISPFCESATVKNGFQSGKQRYKCTSCNKKFQLDYTYQAYYASTNNLITKLLKEGNGVRSISRVLGISKDTVLSRVLKTSKAISASNFQKLGCKFEVDEMWTFIKQKADFTWITYIIERDSEKVIDFFVGSKSKENIKPLIEKTLLLQPKTIFTDKLNVYPSLIPKKIQTLSILYQQN